MLKIDTRAVAIWVGGWGWHPLKTSFRQNNRFSANRFRNQLKYSSGSDEKVIVIAKIYAKFTNITEKVNKLWYVGKYCMKFCMFGKYFSRKILLGKILLGKILLGKYFSENTSVRKILYSSLLHSSFDVNRMRTWKTFCSKCRSFNLSCCS
jgi:hypothetical protein